MDEIQLLPVYTFRGKNSEASIPKEKRSEQTFYDWTCAFLEAGYQLRHITSEYNKRKVR